MPYKVLKPIPNGDGSFHETGEIVYADGWRNLRQLVNGRYLVEVIDSGAEEPAAPAPSRRKRKASTEEQADAE